MKPAPITTTRGPCCETVAQRQRVVEGAQHRHPVELGLIGEAPWRAAGGDDDAVAGHALAGVERHGSLGDIEVDGDGAQAEVELEAFELGRLAQADALRLPVTLQQRLAERRPVVRLVPFGTDEGDRPGVARRRAASRMPATRPARRRPRRSVPSRSASHAAVRSRR